MLFKKRIGLGLLVARAKLNGPNGDKFRRGRIPGNILTELTDQRTEFLVLDRVRTKIENNQLITIRSVVWRGNLKTLVLSKKLLALGSKLLSFQKRRHFRFAENRI